jgi:hypothetical protein
MLTRIAFLTSAVFWVTMSYLLWRSEYSGPNHQGGRVPAAVVWRKIITSPDNSSLDILHHGKKAGYARWAVNERRDPADGSSLVGGLPVAWSDLPKGYRLDLEGNVAPEGDFGRIYFDLSVELTTNRVWERMAVRISIGKSSLAVHMRAAEQSVHLITDDDGDKQDRVLTFDQLKNPQSIAEAFAVPLPEGFAAISNMSTNALEDVLPAGGLVLEARSDWVNIGHTAARAYRLQTRLLDRWQVAIMVSPVGEILRVELPDGWVLASDQTAGF